MHRAKFPLCVIFWGAVRQNVWLLQWKCHLRFFGLHDRSAGDLTRPSSSKFTLGKCAIVMEIQVKSHKSVFRSHSAAASIFPFSRIGRRKGKRDGNDIYSL